MHARKALSVIMGLTAAIGLCSSAAADDDDDVKLTQAIAVVHDFTRDDEQSIPTELLQRARGIAVIPNLIRGGFFIGGRRGRGVLTIRTATGEWSNPAFVTLTGGSIGWQFGAEAADVILIFANDRSVANIQDGKFTFAGDAAVQAGPVGKRSMGALTMRSEVYVYTRNRGLFAGAAFEGARLNIVRQDDTRFYAGSGAQALGPQNGTIPGSARRFLETLATASLSYGTPATRNVEPSEGATIYPLGQGPK
jgi:lipid-binding SYLF domain-containing protein